MEHLEWVLNQADPINQAALERYAECRKFGFWPTGYEEIRIINNL